MKTYTVKQLASIAGITVRTLHHYDQIGLLKPAFVGQNLYRYYGEEQLLRLQQILIHRELDFSLAEIAEIIDMPDFDTIATLHLQRERLSQQASRYLGMVKTIDRTIARIQGSDGMNDSELFDDLVSAEKQAAYEQWLIEKYGPEMENQIAESRHGASQMTREDWSKAMAEFDAIIQPVVEAFRNGVPPQARSLDDAIARHRDWISRAWNRKASIEAYTGLADVYEHPDFVARFDRAGAGFTVYFTAAMRSWAKRQLG